MIKEGALTEQSIYRSAAGERAVMALYDGLLGRWPVPHSTATLATRHGDAFVIASGAADAPPLVLLHGAGTNSTMWGGDVADYSRRYRVLAVDLPGEPGKSAPSRLPWDGPAYAEWLGDVFDALKLEAAPIVGLSQGAWVALKFATAHPERVSALSLLTPGGIVPDKPGFLLRVLPLLLLGRWGKRRINRLVLGGQAVPAEVDEAMTLLSTHFRPRIGKLPIFTDAELRRLTMPVQLVMGGRDVMRDAEAIADRMRRLVPNLTATTIPEAGHAIVGAKTRVMSFLESALAAR
jgi:pimeloyl-ACP methyl ester carboxylesterase